MGIQGAQAVALTSAVAYQRDSIVSKQIVHKGAGTVVTDGERLFVNQTGNSGMATGGTGDVLTGVIAALLGQKMLPFDAAVLGVYVHGLAGDMAAEELGRLSLTALHLIEYLSDAFCELDPAFHGPVAEAHRRSLPRRRAGRVHRARSGRTRITPRGGHDHPRPSCPAGKNRATVEGAGGRVASETTIRATAAAANMTATGMIPVPPTV